MPASAVPPIVDTDVPTWKSPNELIHERINFDDTIWGFGLAGGAYYKTPLRITYVKPGSRAQMAHIYPGDVVLRINGIESSTLTLEEAHQIILESGIHLKIAVTSPEDLEDNYYCYQDPLQSQLEEIQVKQIKHTAIPKFPKVLGKSSHWSLQWPWKCKRKIIYKESNCYLVPSKYEEKHKDTRKPEVKQDDMIVLDSIHNAKGKKNTARKSSNKSKKNKKDGATEQISPVDKNNEDVTEQNSPVDTKNEDVVIEQNTSVQKNPEDVAAEEDTVDKSNKDEVAEQDSFADKSEELTAGDNSSANKNDEDIIAEQNISVVKTEGDNDSEQNNSVHKPDENTEVNHSGDKNDNSDEKPIISEEKNESSVSEQNVLENKNVSDDITEQINFVDRNDEKNSAEVIDSTVKDETDGDNAKFDDIPLMTDSEKLAHNSR